MEPKGKKVYKVVLTGGPCGGKTTGQSRLCTFFENLGWKVFRVPETATVLLSGGVKFTDLTEDEAIAFQENLLKTMLQIENTFFGLAESSSRDCLIICDRGAMDASAFISRDKWEQVMRGNNWNPVELRDNRYNQIVHLVSAANGAEDFYSTEWCCSFHAEKMLNRRRSLSRGVSPSNGALAAVLMQPSAQRKLTSWREEHVCRSEGVELARELDYRAAAAWVGHPYFDVIDNSSDFETKICRMIDAVCQKLGIDTGDRLQTNSRKVKFLVALLPPDAVFPPFQDFDVVHNYLQTNTPKMQVRLRKRGQNGHWSYIHTIRKPRIRDQVVEVKTQLSHRDYLNMVAQRDDSHFTIYKKRRCFLINNQYFQLDVYKEPCHPRCKGLILLETYTSAEHSALMKSLPQFLTIVKEVTGDPSYSMFNLSLREEWTATSKFCHKLQAGPEEEVGSGEKSNGCVQALMSNGM